MVKKGIVGIPHPTTPLMPSLPAHTPTPTPPHPPPPPPPLFNMVNVMKMPILKGLGIEDPKQFLFLPDVVWKS